MHAVSAVLTVEFQLGYDFTLCYSPSSLPLARSPGSYQSNNFFTRVSRVNSEKRAAVSPRAAGRSRDIN